MDAVPAARCHRCEMRHLDEFNAQVSGVLPQGVGKSMVIANEINYTQGYWGQFVDRRGDFHEKNGEKFRAT